MKNIKSKALFALLTFLFSFSPARAVDLMINKDTGYGNATDPYYQYQTYIGQASINEMWYKYTGKGIVVAVLDSGVDLNHADLKNSLWRNYKETLNNKVDDDKNGYVDDYYGYDFVVNNANLSPYNSHGTMVAGIIAAQRNNDVGIAGIASDAKIMPLIVCNNSGCPIKSIIKAIHYAVDNGANIINMSLGGQGSLGYDPEYDEAIKYAYDRNVLIVASAGNGDTDGNGVRGQDLTLIKASPVCNEGDTNMILGVAALTEGGQPTSWTNYSQKYVDVAALGENVFSSSIPLYTKNSYSYSYMDGTSFSAPIVSGVAALLKEKHPDWKNYELINQIVNNSDYFDEGYNVYGRILNAKKIVNGDRPAVEVTSVTPTVIDNGQNIITILGERFYNDVDIKFSNSQFSGSVPKSIMNVSEGVITFDVSKWANLQPSSEPYSVTINNWSNWGNPVKIEIKNVKTSNPVANVVNNNPTSQPANSATVSNSSSVDVIFANKLKGKILLQTESHGEAWYVNPKDGKKYYMANGQEAYNVMRKFGVGLTNKDLEKIKNNKIFAKKNSGKIFLQVESKGEAYYIDFNGAYHYLKDGLVAYEVMRSLGLGISNINLDKIPTGSL